jgi:hypothetical protein
MPSTAPTHAPDPPTSGVIHCLRLLAEEAAGLGLPRTHVAICQVLQICEAACCPTAPGTHGPQVQ